MSPDLACQLRQSSVAVTGGSGVIWSSDGFIVTNAHVLHARDPKATIKVTLDDGRSFTGAIEQVDRRRDLALLKIQATGLPAATIGDSSTLRPGQVVTAVGNPLGVTGAVATGIIHAVEGSRWVQADVRLAPGNSGGLLADSLGRVIGINTMIVGGLAMAVPSNTVSAFVSGEDADRPILGISMQPVELQGRQLLAIVDVAKDSLAARSGLLIGDILLFNAAQLERSLNARGTLQLRFLRGGEPREIAIQLPQPVRQAEAHAA